jgi:hypothetical protein
MVGSPLPVNVGPDLQTLRLNIDQGPLPHVWQPVVGRDCHDLSYVRVVIWKSETSSFYCDVGKC